MVDELNELREKKKQELLNQLNKKQPSVIVYSTTTCPYCNMVKQYLTQKGIEFEDKNVSINPMFGIEMVRKSGQQGVPVIDIDGKIIIGFNKPAIDAALGLSSGG